jgi:uncharacterized membrane protein HdeD (DUF308 family)
MIAPIGLGILLVVAGLATLFVPGIGIVGIVLMVVGVLLIVGAVASRRRAAGAPPS